MDDIAKIAAGLSDAQQRALVPWQPFSDQVGLSLVALGLYAIPDGVDGLWKDTPLGLAVRDCLRSKNNG